MRALRAIAGRETAAFFHSAMSPVVVVGFLALTGFAFVNVLFDYAAVSKAALSSGQRVSEVLTLTSGVFEPLVRNMVLFLVFMLPAVTMRLFSEEFRSGRDGLVMTYPVEDHVWVLGKALAGLGVAWVLLGGTALFFGVTAALGRPEAGPLFAAALGMTLVAGMMVAWGVFFSTLLPYQVVSYILTFAFLMILTNIESLEPHLPAAVAPLAKRLSLGLHFGRFARGLIDVRDLVWFGGWIVLGLSAATASLGGRRRAGGRRWARWAPVLVLAVLLLVLDTLAVRSPRALDLTPNRRNSLAPQTERVLDALDVDLHITAFYQRLDPRRREAEDLLGAFARRSDRISFEVVDPDVALSLVQDLEVNAARSVVVEGAGRRRDLLDPDESALINAAFRVMVGRSPVVYHLQGHGERRLDDEARTGYQAYDRALRRQGYDVRPLLLSEAPQVPADAHVVVIASPLIDFAQRELTALHTFVARGGAVLALLDPGAPETLAEWTGRYNIVPGDDFLVDAARLNREQRGVVAIREYGDHEITRSLPGMYTLFPFTQSLLPRVEGLVGVKARAVLMTGPRSWAERDPASMTAETVTFDEGVDVQGPLPFGVALEILREDYFDDVKLEQLGVAREDVFADNAVMSRLRDIHAGDGPQLPPSIFARQEASRLVVVGDADFASNAHINLYGNRDLLLNMLGWLTREQVLIAPRARADHGEPLLLETGRRNLIGWSCAVAWPLLAGLAAVVVVVRRRRYS